MNNLFRFLGKSRKSVQMVIDHFQHMDNIIFFSAKHKKNYGFKSSRKISPDIIGVIQTSMEKEELILEIQQIKGTYLITHTLQILK